MMSISYPAFYFLTFATFFFWVFFANFGERFSLLKFYKWCNAHDLDQCHDWKLKCDLFEWDMKVDLTHISADICKI